MNNVSMVGRICSDIESKEVGTTVLTKFRLAVNRPFKKDVSDFFDVTCWGKTAEFVAKYIKKGHLVGFTGNAQVESWEKDGVKRSKVTFTANSVESLTSKKDAEAMGDTSSGSEFVPVNDPDENMDDVPF